jgi:tRNA 2-selenouridine synthase
MKKDLHKQNNPRVAIDQIWGLEDVLFVDVRAPGEFESGHIPGAISIPLLEDKEKETIGILYKKFGQQKAIEKGYEYLDQKLDDFYNQFEILPADKPLIVYCARGGMRSQVITSMLSHLSYHARQLINGYKAFRNWNLAELEAFKFKFPVILHGQTGVGKTLVLNRLDNSLDLEGLADHRGSLFGGIGKLPVSQKTFEANLLVRLQQLDNNKPIFIEGESRKIGDVSIHNSIFTQMRSARAVLLESTMNVRVQRTIEEYINQQPDSLGAIKETIGKLARDLGHKAVAKLIKNMDEGDYAACFEYILLHYYDRKYSHSMSGLSFNRTISTEDLDQAVRELNEYSDEFISR